MGGKKKAFIDKKRSATFTLVSRDSSSSSDPLSTDRVFVRTDNTAYSVPGFEEPEDDQQLHDNHLSSSIFDDALEDGHQSSICVGGSELPEDVRRQILELGLPDDGYNYLRHLREIKNQGGGSAYYDNPKAQFHLLPLDVKAYDASRVKITPNILEKEEETKVDSICTVASKAAPVRVQKAVDPDVARLLDDSDDLSRFGSDVEDLEEDFVLVANQPEGDEEEEEEEEEERENKLLQVERESKSEKLKIGDEMESHDLDDVTKQRVRRLLDDQFDLLALEEYDNDDDDDDDIEGEDRDALSDGENESLLAEKLKDTLKDFGIEGPVTEEKYKVPADSVSEDQECAQIIRKCSEYAQRYLMDERQEDDKEVVFVSESSDESEKWDCDTIISTYSNMENHPAKIQAPGNPRRPFPPKSVKFPGDLVVKKDVIALGGKEMLPLNYLPQRKRMVESLVRENVGSGEKPKRKVGEESKDEKKQRKAAIKNEKRESRKAKKELKELYKGENKRAQKVAAFSGPPSLHLM